MEQIIVEGVRCFHDRQSAPLRPITILVGENSTGKTTFLSLARIAWDLCQGKSLIDFNENPFTLGAYDQIASYRGDKTGTAVCFAIGARVSTSSCLKRELPHELSDVISVTGHFIRQGTQPKLQKWTLDLEPYRIEIVYAEDGEWSRVTVTTPSGTVKISEFAFLPFSHPTSLFRYLYSIFHSERTHWDDTATVEVQDTVPSHADLDLLVELADELVPLLGYRPYAFAPIRAHPQRTYDPLTDVPEPEGYHIPMILAQDSFSNSKNWEQLRESIDSFGKASGLFSNIKVRRMGEERSDPFQIRVKISGTPFNLVDVGYGVSQVLPIIVESLRRPARSTFLLQQPEIHLHPRAQAELGSFLALVAKQYDKRFLIETHSDYLVDRIRMDVRESDYLSESDVSILYFERVDGGVRIQPLEVDRFGNIVNAPAGYRQFFLEEEKRLLWG